MREIAVTLCLCALLNMSTGCSHSIRQVRVNEDKSQPTANISAMTMPVTIDGYIGVDGDTTMFAEGSGRFDRRSLEISGRLEDGTSSTASLDQLQWIRLRQGTLNGFVPQLVDRGTFLIHSGQRPWRMVDSLCVQDGAPISFKEFGGFYDSASHMVTGVIDDGTKVKIDANDVYTVSTRKFSPGRLLISTALVVGAIYVVAAILYTAAFLEALKTE